MRYRGLPDIAHDAVTGANFSGGNARTATAKRQRRQSPSETPAGKKAETIPQRATKPSLIITTPDREKNRQRTFGLSHRRAHDNQPAAISDDIASWNMR
jgi:hypothetical protein